LHRTLFFQSTAEISKSHSSLLQKANIIQRGTLLHKLQGEGPANSAIWSLWLPLRMVKMLYKLAASVTSTVKSRILFSDFFLKKEYC